MALSFTNGTKLGHRPALDGLRGVAVLAVMLFHFETRNTFPGGSLGVDIFFVLSGFLITTLLLEEWQSSGTISLRNFYLRRALRLLPALVVFLGIYVFINFAFHAYDFTGHQGQGKVLTCVIAVMTYLYNWLVAAKSTLTPRAFSHLWSLSVEEQYYLIWPAFLITILKFHRNAVALMALSTAIILASALLPFLLGNRDENYVRLYFGTDFRAQELMTGSLLAQLCAAGLIRREVAQKPITRAFFAVSAGFYLYWLLEMKDRPGFLFNGGYTASAVAGAFLVLACSTIKGGLPGMLMTNRLIVYVGQRSYALYLWHMPVNYWLRRFDSSHQFVFAVALSFALAEISYRIVERPALGLKARFGHGASKQPVLETELSSVRPRAA